MLLLRDTASENKTFDTDFSADETSEAINSLIIGKAAGLDDIRNKIIKNLPKDAKRWLLQFFQQLMEYCLPNIWRYAKVVVV